MTSYKGGNTERGKIAIILEQAQQCSIADALVKARANSVSCSTRPPQYNGQVQSESSYLKGLLEKRPVYQPSQPGCTTQSVRIARIQQSVNENFAPYDNPSRRFIEYQGPQIAVVCPATPTAILNASMPKPSTDICTRNAILNSGGAI